MFSALLHPLRHLPRVPLGLLCITTLIVGTTGDPVRAQEAGRVDGLQVLGQDTIPDVIISPESGVLPSRVLDGATGAELGAGFPFGPVATGARIALGDLTGDGVPDIVAGQGPGGSLVQLFNGLNVAPLGGGFPFGPAFGGGVFVALGDMNGDGTNDIAVAQGAGGGEIRVFSGAGYGFLFSVTPFAGYAGGVTLAAGDFTGDGRADLLAGQLGGALVSVINGATRQSIVSGAPFGGGFRGGVFVAAGDVNGDGFADAIVSPGSGGGSVDVYDLQTVSLIGRFSPYGDSAAGVRVAASDLTGDGRAEIITGPGPGGGSSVRVFSGPTFAPVWTVPGYGADHAGGVLVAAPVTTGTRFTSAGSTTFTVGQAGTFSVTTLAAAPVSTITVSGTLPAGVTFTDLGNGTARLSGTPAPGTGGVYALTFTAASSTGAAVVQAFQLTVNEPPAITSANTVTFTTLVSGSFTVQATGFPVTQLSAAGALPPGITFTDNGNNTATLSGTPSSTAAGTYPITITAANGVGTPATQAFTVIVEPCSTTLSPPAGPLPRAALGTPYSQAFTAMPGSGYAFAVTSGALPPGLTLSPAGVLSGSPTTSGAFSFTITASGAGCSAAAAYSITVGPNAADDSYAGGVGNTQFSVGAGTPATPAVVTTGSVLANDAGSGILTAGPATITTAHGGTVAMAANGTFLYTPAAGFAGPSDSFTYNATDENGSADTGTVTIAMSGVVWYVNAGGPAGTGQSHNPFNAMPAAAAAAQPGQVIYVRGGNPAGATQLKTGQTLWGAGAPFVLNGLTLPAGATPTLQGSVQLADQVHIGGVSINGSGNPAVLGSNLIGTATLDSVAIVGGSVGLELSQSAGTVNVNGGTISGVSAAGVGISGGTGTVNVGASISVAAGHPVQIDNHTGGTVTFSGPITGTGAGVQLTNNPGAVIAFTGGLALTTGANAAFIATGGGTVTATQNNTSVVNTITTTTGTALQVIDTQIGAAGLTFRSITAGEGPPSPGNAILLENTGTGAQNGGLTITGAGTPRSGGLIRRKSGADGVTTSGIGIYLSNTKNASFSWIELNTLSNGGIVGRNVAGFQLLDSVLMGPLGNATGLAEGPIVFGVPAGLSIPAAGGLSGSGLIRNTVVEGTIEHNVAFYNSAGSMQLRIDRTNGVEGGCQIAGTAPVGEDGLHVELSGTATAVVTVDSCRMRNNRRAGIALSASGSASLTGVITASEFVAANQGLYGLLATDRDQAHTGVTAQNSSFFDFRSSAILLQQADEAATGSLLEAVIANNQLTQSLPSPEGAILALFSGASGGAAEARLLLEGNVVSQYGLEPGIVVDTRSAAAATNAHVTLVNNHVDMYTPATPDGTERPIGTSIRAAQPATAVCARLISNISHAYPPPPPLTGGGIRLEQSGTAALLLERGTQGLDATPLTVVQVNNPASEATVLGSIAVVENGSCQLPGLTPTAP